jgi:hypothetical protein
MAIDTTPRSAARRLRSPPIDAIAAAMPSQMPDWLALTLSGVRTRRTRPPSPRVSRSNNRRSMASSVARGRTTIRRV